MFDKPSAVSSFIVFFSYQIFVKDVELMGLMDLGLVVVLWHVSVKSMERRVGKAYALLLEHKWYLILFLLLPRPPSPVIRRPRRSNVSTWWVYMSAVHMHEVLRK